MKLRIKDLYPNPFRLFETYQLDPDVVEALVQSMLATGIWDNLMARHVSKEAPGGIIHNSYELCYGAHRMAAFRELIKRQFIDDEYNVEVCVRRLDDMSMVKIMAQERAPAFSYCQFQFYQTVDAVRKFITKETREPNIGVKDVCGFVGSAWPATNVIRAYRKLGLKPDGSSNAG